MPAAARGAASPSASSASNDRRTGRLGIRALPGKRLTGLALSVRARFRGRAAAAYDPGQISGRTPRMRLGLVSCPLPFTVVSMPTRDVHVRLADLGAGYEHVVVDTPPGDFGIIRSAILACGTVLVPVSPTGLDQAHLASAYVDAMRLVSIC
jgi:hypothetical protein